MEQKKVELSEEIDGHEYISTSGVKYKYDLSRSSDKMRYDLDIKAQSEDKLNVDTRVERDKNIGQYGGGIYRE